MFKVLNLFFPLIFIFLKPDFFFILNLFVFLFVRVVFLLFFIFKSENFLFVLFINLK